MPTILEKMARGALESRQRGNRAVSPLLLAIIVVLTLIFLFIIDFDLTIFSRS